MTPAWRAILADKTWGAFARKWLAVRERIAREKAVR